MNQLIIIQNLLTAEIIEYVFDLIKKSQFEDSKVGTRVDPKQKIRRDIFINSQDCIPIDSLIFTSIDRLIKDDFNVSLKYRERWKVGFYDGSDKGHYGAHTDVQGKMEHRQLSFIIALSDPSDYQGGELFFPELNQSFKFQKGSAIVLRSELLHSVKPVISGERYTLLSFMFDRENGLQSGRDLKQYTPTIIDNKGTPISPESGIKYYSRTMIVKKNDPSSAVIKQDAQPQEIEIGPVRNAESPEVHAAISTASQGQSRKEHDEIRYLLTISPDSGPGNQISGFKEALIMGKILNRKVLLPPIHQHYMKGKRSWKFTDIFQYTIPNEVFDISADEPDLYPNNSYVLHRGFLNKKLKVELMLDLSLEEHVLKQRHFRNINDYQELSELDEQVLCVKHLFNNTAISECLLNGCTECKINPVLEPLYKEVCENLGFSDHIKEYGNQFISSNLHGDYIAVHLRYPDVMANKSLKSHANYDETSIHDAVLVLAKRNNVSPANIFIATNNAKQLQSSPLKRFFHYDVDHEDDINSFVEQYVCCNSKVFVMSKYNNYSKIDQPHQRSTWSTFVADYRKYRHRNENNVLLNGIL